MIDPCASSTPSRFVLFLSSVLILDVGRLVLPPFSDQSSYHRTTRVSEGRAQAATRDSHNVWFVLLSLDCSRVTSLSVVLPFRIDECDVVSTSA